MELPEVKNLSSVMKMPLNKLSLWPYKQINLKETNNNNETM